MFRERTVGIDESAACYNVQSSVALGGLVQHWPRIADLQSSTDQSSVAFGYRALIIFTMSSKETSCDMSLLADHNNWTSGLVRIFTSVGTALVYGTR